MGESKGPTSYEMAGGRRALAALQPLAGRTLVDLGCGPGDYSLHAARLVGPAGRVLALDRDIHPLAALRSQGAANLHPMAADLGAALPLTDGCADVCLLATVLYILGLPGDGDALLGRAARLLAPGGRLAVIEAKKQERPWGPPLEMRLSPDQVARAAAPHGLTQLQYLDLDEFYMLCLLKRR